MIFFLRAIVSFVIVDTTRIFETDGVGEALGVAGIFRSNEITRSSLRCN